MFCFWSSNSPHNSLTLVILPCFCHQPVQPQHYYGPNFGYIVAFRPYDNKEWRKVMVAEPQARSYIHKDLTFPPLTKFQVKVKAFNSRGEGPFSLTAVIYSAQDGESSTHSQLFCTRRQHTLTPGPPRPLSPPTWVDSSTRRRSSSSPSQCRSAPALSLQSDLFHRDFSRSV